jgi:hypothetical protein
MHFEATIVNDFQFAGTLTVRLDHHLPQSVAEHSAELPIR